MYQVTLHVLGICCLDTLSLLEKGVKDLCGIISFKSSLPKGRIVIEFNPSLVSSMKIVDEVENQGFAVVKSVQKEYHHEIYN